MNRGYLKKTVHTRLSTFAIVTEPLDPFPELPGRCLVSETALPYFCLRTTQDNRLLVGGFDLAFATSHKQEGLVERQAKKFLEKLREMFPVTDLETAYAWAGTFGATEDGLPHIGMLKDLPHAHFAVGYGITSGFLAAQIIRDSILRKLNGEAELFRFGR